MLYFKLEGDSQAPLSGQVLEVSEDHNSGFGWVNRNDFKTFADAENIANQASAYLQDGIFLAVDQGSSTWPRYDVIRAPLVGAPVSYGFNGDYYPDGYITKVGGTNCSRVYTSTGSVYNRRRKSSSWVKRGGTWSLVQGHRDERNPSF